MKRSNLIEHFCGDDLGLAGDDLEALVDYTIKLHKFFRWAMWQEGDWCGAIDGEDLQEKAAQLGLIEQALVKEPCCGQCACAEVYGEDQFPVNCYRYVEDLDDPG